MVKIKRKVEKNLPQLIEWAWNNDVKGEIFPIDQNEESGIYFATNSDFMMNNADYIRYNNTFTVEVEETVTEDTVIPKMLVIGRFDGYEEVYNRKLNNFTQHLLSAYLIHDDGHMELIYDERKGLVE